MVDTLHERSILSSVKLDRRSDSHEQGDSLIRSGALFRGISPSLIRAAPAAASTFVAFELTRGNSLDKWVSQ